MFVVVVYWIVGLPGRRSPGSALDPERALLELCSYWRTWLGECFHVFMCVYIVVEVMRWVVWFVGSVLSLYLYARVCDW